MIDGPLGAAQELTAGIVQVAAPQVENQYGVQPGSLVEEGVLTALDANQICIQVTVRNTGKEPLRTGLLLDPAVLELDNGKSVGRVDVNVPPGGAQMIMLHAKNGIRETQTDRKSTRLNSSHT